MSVCTRAFSLALSALLALSSCLPCYTLAYADEGSAYVLEEEDSEVLRSDGGGVSAAPGEFEFAPDAADEGAAGGGVGPEPEGPGETEASSSADGGVDSPVGDIDISPYATSFSVIDTLVGSAWSGEGTQFVIGGNKIAARNGTVIWAVLAAADILESIDSKMTVANNYFQAIDTATKGIQSVLRTQWGYKVGTAWVSENNSPYYFLQWIYNSTWTAWGYNYDGTPSFFSNSPAGWLNNVSGKVNSFFPAMNNSLADISARINLIRVPVETYLGASFNTLADISARTNLIRQAVETYIGPIFNNVVDVSARIALVRSELLAVKDLLSAADLAGASARLDDIFLALDSDTGISRLLAEWADRWDVQDRVLMEWADRWDVQDRVLMEWGARWDVQDRMMVEWGNAWEAYRDSVLSALGDGLSLDVSGIESRLDDIRGLLLAAGMAENAKDLLDLLIGDLSGIGQAAATGAIQGAMESVFPFCVPAVVKQVFGLLAYEGSAPVWEFDICGHPLVCDFSGFQLVADCTSWLSRVGLVLALLANTRKFVFSLNGGGSS